MRVKAMLASLVAAALAAPAAGQPISSVSLGEFRSVELRGGGRVTVRHAPARGFMLREGNLALSRVELVGDRLVIERCRDHCPHGYRLEVEVTAPEIDALAVTDGGLLQASGDFPARAALAIAVVSGGMIDARSLPAAQVAAAVQQGGGILVRPGRELAASVSNGGIVTYFGDARVTSSVSHGGAVVRGEAADADRPLADLHRPLPALPVPPVPALLPHGKPAHSSGE
ncbi:hypothetical protein [Sphingosinicella sp.]|uniref:hypothetical protein n=1 Tax=Sphingosinicella sp. TaxID=1917971 RepID=UPI00403769ED